jgi:hypothetical protein
MFGRLFQKQFIIADVGMPTPEPIAVERGREAEASVATLARIVRLSDEIAATTRALDAAGFRSLAESHAEARRTALHAEEVTLREVRRARVARMREERLGEGVWQAKVERALEAALRGENELLLLRFPSELCEDGGRMINAPDPDWPSTLRGPAAEIHALWQAELKPLGFGLTARILEFPDGFPGDAGISLTW